MQDANAAALLPPVQDKPHPIASNNAVSPLSLPGGHLLRIVIMVPASVILCLIAQDAVTDGRLRAATGIDNENCGTQ
jgi:hypothetical protein